ncbi:hypothetical protein T06_4320 [Trichinella sp. T6]|nr:hypothetical protein T06_4320 [Trichinella sp. T6]
MPGTAVHVTRRDALAARPAFAGTAPIPPRVQPRPPPRQHRKPDVKSKAP